MHLDLEGWPVTLLDTAGIRDTDDPVEQEGVRRARERAGAADLVLWVVDARDLTASGAGESENEPKSTEKAASGPPIWLIRNKIDLIRVPKQRNELELHSMKTSEARFGLNKPLKNIAKKRLRNKTESKITKNDCEFNISAVTGEGFERLLAQLARHAEGFLAGAESALVTRERHRRALEDVLAALRRAQGREVAGHEDLLAEELRIAARALGRLTGRVDVEDILDVIFRDFCIGK